MKLDIKPKLVYNIGPNAVITFFYKLGIVKKTKYSDPVVELDSAGALIDTGVGIYKDPKAILTNAFQIDMIWKF